MNIHNVEEWAPKLEEWEQQIHRHDDDSIRARWASGSWLVTLKRGQQLPKRVLAYMAAHFKVHRSELTARMKFATTFKTEEQVAKVISEYRTWYGIKQFALTGNPREKKPSVSILRRVLALLEKVEDAWFVGDDLVALDEIESCVIHYRQAITQEKDKRRAAQERLEALCEDTGAVSMMEASEM